MTQTAVGDKNGRWTTVVVISALSKENKTNITPKRFLWVHKFVAYLDAISGSLQGPIEGA
jgi:hypothetical protein